MPWAIDIAADTATVRIDATAERELLPELVALELSLGRKQARALTLAFASDTVIPVERLQRLDYRRIDDRHYTKAIPTRRAVRFSITEKCNYRCFFCHEEGLQMDVVRHDADDARLYQVLDQLKVLGYNDFTFTGGEPLLKWRRILRCLEHMRRIDYLPDVKFVSNGLPLHPEFVTGLQAYPGRVRFNLSLHSLEPERYHQVVHALAEGTPGTRNDLAQVKANLARLREAGIPFKLNFVLLKGINTTPAALTQIFDYALSSGARRVKFLELLITEPLRRLYPYYYRLQALRDQLADQLTFVSSGQRRTVYRYRDTPLEVELQSCTCSRGCNVCALNRDANFTAELRYFPCFLHPEQGSDLTTSTLADAVAAGAGYIDGMARYYGDHSPLIIRDRYLTRRETAFYYAIAAADVARFLKEMSTGDGLELTRHRQLTEYYFSDDSDAFATFQCVRKLAINSYDHHATEITQQLWVDAAGSGRIDTAFSKESPAVADIAAYEQELKRQGFAAVLQADWSIDYYANPRRTGRGLELSIGAASGRADALVRSNRPLASGSCSLLPLTQPVPAWLADR
ncbi:MAG: radical SAM protein [Thiohalocapsa sp.]|nr:radical SAM protein [Thiohalocapsa sp.]